MTMLYVFMVLCLVGSARADYHAEELYVFGACPNLEVQQNFDASQYMGRWFYAEGYLLSITCDSIEYSAGEDGTINFKKTIYGVVSGTKQPLDTGVLRTPDASVPGKLKQKFNDQPSASERDYWVLKTDYTSYAVVFDCTQVNRYLTAHIQKIWILTRKMTPAESVIAEAYEVIKKNNLVKSKYINKINPYCKDIWQQKLIDNYD